LAGTLAWAPTGSGGLDPRPYVLFDRDRPLHSDQMDAREAAMTTVHVAFPDDVFASLRKSPREVEREVRLAAVIDWYRRGLISQGRAAELATISRADFLDELAARRIDVFDVDIEELRREIERA
jgi:predicted HTH domain antitoxin